MADDGVVLRYADEVFADCQVAIETLCLGCPDERGWSFANEDIPEPVGDVCCEYMVNDVTDCEKPVVMDLDGEPFCYMRYLRFVKTEYEKYLKRMKGDWS